MKKIVTTILILSWGLLLPAANALTSANYQLNNSTINGGAAKLDSTYYHLEAKLSPSIVSGNSSSANYLLTGTDGIDADADGVSDEVEKAGFNGGDGNGNGIADFIEPHVASALNPVTGFYTTLEISGGCGTISDLNIYPESSFITQDSSANYPLGFVDFIANCGSAGATATVKLYYTTQYSTAGYYVRKYNPLLQTYTTLSGVTFGTALVGTTTVTTVTYTVTDGSSLDSDNLPPNLDGVVRDPVGIASVVAMGGGGGGSSSSTNAVVVPEPKKVEEPEEPKPEELPKNYVVTQISERSVLVTWQTIDKTNAITSVKYSTQSPVASAGASQTTSPKSDNSINESVLITGLVPCTRYYFLPLSVIDGYTVKGTELSVTMQSSLCGEVVTTTNTNNQTPETNNITTPTQTTSTETTVNGDTVTTVVTTDPLTNTKTVTKTIVDASGKTTSTTEKSILSEVPSGTPQYVADQNFITQVINQPVQTVKNALSAVTKRFQNLSNLGSNQKNSPQLYNLPESENISSEDKNLEPKKTTAQLNVEALTSGARLFGFAGVDSDVTITLIERPDGLPATHLVKAGAAGEWELELKDLRAGEYTVVATDSSGLLREHALLSLPSTSLFNNANPVALLVTAISGIITVYFVAHKLVLWVEQKFVSLPKFK